MSDQFSPWSFVELSGAYRVARRLTRSAVAVLTYHRIRADGAWSRDQRHPNVLSVTEFDNQVADLARHYQILSGDTFKNFLINGEPLPPHTVLLTFDDGYRDNHLHALPVLRRHNASAIFFVSTSFVGSRDNRLWLDELDAIITAVGEEQLASWLLATRLPAELRDRRRFRVWMKQRERAQRQQLLGSLRQAFPTAPALDAEPMTWEDVEELAEAGMTIGSHTVTHQILGAASREEVRDELYTSRAEIEKRLGRPCWAFSYPNGESSDFRPADMNDVRAAGYVCAFTQITGFVTGRSEHYALPRIPVPATHHLAVFRSRVSGVHAWLHSLRPQA